MKIALEFHCAFPGCTVSAAAELDRYLGLPPEGWTYRLVDNLPDAYYCPEHADAAEAEESNAPVGECKWPLEIRRKDREKSRVLKV
ncbi:MAG TPA: hypothetical protein VGR70_20715 [Stellaceae bacterium]|nr:hypothetical protein [Stellaceae bacterium]